MSKTNVELLDLFSASAMNGLLANSKWLENCSGTSGNNLQMAHDIAKTALDIAEAMIIERETKISELISSKFIWRWSL